MISELSLTNFKCFQDERIELSSFNLLSGLNGMGKSTVLQALLLLRQSLQQGLLSTSGLALNGALVSIGTAQDALFRGAQEDVIGFGIRWQSNLSGVWTFGYDREADVLKAISPPPDRDIFLQSLFTDDFQYLAAERIGPRTSFTMSEYDVKRHRQLGARGEFVVHYLSEYGSDPLPNPALRHERAASDSLRDQVEAWMSEVSPGTRLHFDPHREMDLVGLQYSTQAEPLPADLVRPTNFGFGVTYALPVLTAILAAWEGTLLLVENPEAHLHPRGQVVIGDLLSRAAAGGVQVMVETHSDHVLNGTRLAVHRGAIEPDSVRLHYFRRSTGLPETQAEAARTEVLSPRIDRNGRIDFWPEGFFDEWSRSLDELLEPAT